MFKFEKNCSIVCSVIMITLLVITGCLYSSVSSLFVIVIPLYGVTVAYLLKNSDSREKLSLAINSCLDESDFNVLDKIEKLRIYFSDTNDLISYLSVVDSKILTFVFDKRNSELLFKDLVKGAITCLSIFEHSHCSFFYNIDVISIPESERVRTLLSTIYMVSKHLKNGSSNIYITTRQVNSNIVVDVSNQFRDSFNDDNFTEKLLTIFSTTNYRLSSGKA